MYKPADDWQKYITGIIGDELKMGIIFMRRNLPFEIDFCLGQAMISI